MKTSYLIQEDITRGGGVGDYLNVPLCLINDDLIDEELEENKNGVGGLSDYVYP